MRKLLYSASLLGLLALALYAQQKPAFEDDGQLKRPENVREWVYLSSGMGMQYDGDRPGNNFTNVFAEPTAYKEFVKSGKWPEGTMLAMEVRRGITEGSINKGGRFQTDLLALEVTVKDSKRFPKDGWDYFAFNGDAKTARAIGQTAGCNACHNKNAAVENTFVQFYPTLIEIARSKGTYKSEAH
jgi:hypothetical protein